MFFPNENMATILEIYYSLNTELFFLGYFRALQASFAFSIETLNKPLPRCLRIFKSRIITSS